MDRLVGESMCLLVRESVDHYVGKTMIHWLGKSIAESMDLLDKESMEQCLGSMGWGINGLENQWIFDQIIFGSIGWGWMDQ